ncbi:MAG: Crp/Fnr family transcriptional regulator [Hyphomicrobiales bacterium]
MAVQASSLSDLLLPWAGKSEDERHRFADAIDIVRLPAGFQAFAPGSPCQSYLVVLEGSVRVQMLSDTGREILLYRVHPGESCVLTTACLLGDESYPAEGVVETETVAASLPISRFRNFLAESETFRNQVFAGFGRRISDILARMEDAVFHRLDARLARFLTDQAVDGAVSATHQDIAAELGTAREVISRQLKAFERDELVSLMRGRIEIVDRRRLHQLATTVT